MLPQRAWLAFSLLALAGVAGAQTAPPRLSGTLTQTVSGQSTQARLFWQAPDSLKIEVLSPRGDVAQTVLAQGNQTLSFDGLARRLIVTNANIAREWFRGWGLAAGGPANFAFSGASGFNASKDRGVTLVRDKTLLGNDSSRAYYIAWKERVRAFPAQITIVQGTRTDFDDAKTVLMRAKITFDAQNVPQSASVEAGSDQIAFTYALSSPAQPFPEGTFALPVAAKGAIHEDAVIKSPSSYGDASADELCNRGAALWSASGDASGALALFERASTLAPGASAPRLLAFEVALATRQSGAAARSLDALKPLLSEADLAWLRARLDILRGDPLAARADLKVAASTNDPARLHAYALALKGCGDVDGARALWNGLLAQNDRTLQVLAAENLALVAGKDELSRPAPASPRSGEAAMLARALLDLRGGREVSVTFTSPELEAALARGFECADREEAARRAWESVEASGDDAQKNQARAHLVGVLARTGDVSAALGAWSRWNATLRAPLARESAQNVVFDAFLKAGRTEALRVALNNRARSTGAKDPDLRLFLAFQEAFGSDQEIAQAVDLGLSRFGKEAFWEGKKAEKLVSQGFLMAPLTLGEQSQQRALFTQALDLLNEAIKTAPEPAFYEQQRALVQIQRATKATNVTLDAGETVGIEDKARAVLSDLDQSSDPDFLTVAAVGWSAMPTRADKARALISATKALDSPPVDGDRTTLVFANRQALARVLDPQSAALQWKALLDVTRAADDEATLAAAMLNGMDARKDATGMAQLLVRIAGERWPLEASAALLNGTAARIAASPLLAQVAPLLDIAATGAPEGQGASGAILARAALALARLGAAKAAISRPGAPPSADAELERAQSAQTAALAQLSTLSQSEDVFWSSRARLLLLDFALSPDAKRQALSQLAARVPGEPSVALAMANASGDPEVRAQTARTLAFSPATWRRLSLDALAGGDRDGALFWSAEAFAYALHAPEVAANEFQRVAFARAKVLWATGDTNGATTIYNTLAGSGWNPTDRAAALLALRRRLQEAKQTDLADALVPRIQELRLSQDDVRVAQAFLSDVDG